MALDDLSEYDRNLFPKDHDGQCPGLVKMDFYGDGKPTWGRVLPTGEQTKQKVELVIVRKLADAWEIRLIETTDGTPVVWSQRSGKYKDVYGQETLLLTPNKPNRNLRRSGISPIRKALCPMKRTREVSCRPTMLSILS
jgi:hypothetical protein